MVRMWMVYPTVMCRKHLLGEHVELHMIVGSIIKGKNLMGHITKEQIFPEEIIGRHIQLVLEMVRREYKHESPIPRFTIPEQYKGYWSNALIENRNLAELMKRCPACRERIELVNRRMEQQ